jgi:hypothetical protein
MFQRWYVFKVSKKSFSSDTSPVLIVFTPNKTSLGIRRKTMVATRHLHGHDPPPRRDHVEAPVSLLVRVHSDNLGVVTAHACLPLGF